MNNRTLWVDYSNEQVIVPDTRMFTLAAIYYV